MALDLRHSFFKQENLLNVKFLGAAFVKKTFLVTALKYKFPVAALFTDFLGPKLASARINEIKTCFSLQGGHICNECLLPVALSISV
jgi:hypothetical protein